jgi:hypothetical protein
MNKAQFSALNIVGGICGLLIICDLVLGMLNSRLNARVAQTQAQFNQAQQIHNTAQNLVVRIAQARQIVQDFNIQWTPGQAASSPGQGPAPVPPGQKK